MKKLLHFTSVLFCTLLLCFCITPELIKAADTTTVSIDLQYGQTEARKILDMVNTFRTTPEEAWAWEEGNLSKINYSNLSPLQYDYELEKTAMLRAAEIALSFDHTRPNGTDCFTAYQNSSVYTAKGENIAAGQQTGAAVFESWQETNEDYTGQGHRRNMLSDKFNTIGIGHVYYNGTHYWVQEFGRVNSLNTAQTPANDNQETVSVDVLSSNISNVSLSAGTQSVSLKIGESTSLPKISLTADFSGHYPSKSCPIYIQDNSPAGSLTWTSANTNIAAVSNGNIQAIAEGRTTVSAAWNGSVVSCEVTVYAPSGSNNGSNTGTNNGSNTGTNNGSNTTYQREYTITFNANYGTMREDSRKTTVNQKLTSLPVAIRDGYTFKGWYTQSTGGNLITTSTIFSANTEVYAQWDTSSSNFSDLRISDITDTTASITAIIPNCYVRTWGISLGTSSSYIPEVRVLDCYASTSVLSTSFTNLTPNTTYYYRVYYIADTIKLESGIGTFTTAKPSEYTIIFHPNGGTLNGQSSIVTLNQKLPSLPSASREDYTFDGWYTEPYSGTLLTTDTAIRSSSTVYAHWTYHPGTAPSNPIVTDPNSGNTNNPTNSSTNNDNINNTDTDLLDEPISVKKVKLKSVKNTAKGKIKVKWSWNAYGDGYQIAYSTKKNFASDKTNRKIAGVFTDSKTISGLKKGKTYYVRVRAYQKVDGKKYFGAWSNVKKIKIKK